MGGYAARARRAAPAVLVLVGLTLAWVTQVSPRLHGPALAGAGLLGLVGGLVTLACLGSGWWRSWAVRAWLGFWLVYAAALPLTMRAAPMPDPDPVNAARIAEDVFHGAILPITIPAPTTREEVTQLGLSAVAATVLLVLSRGRAAGVAALRWMWFAVIVTTAPVAIREIATDRHIITTKYGAWFFTPHTASGPFQNPNNYGCVLAAAVGVLLVWLLEETRRAVRVAVALVAALGAALTWLTLSRAAAGLVVLEVLVVGCAWAARRGWWRALAGATRGRIGVRVLLAAAVAGLAALPFVVPALAARNPFLRMVRPDASAPYDALRYDLTRTGLRYWSEHPWFGTGAGTFETRVAAEVPTGMIDYGINMHDGFVELLSQYGLVVFVPFVLLLGLLAWYAIRPWRGPSGAQAPAAGAHRAGLACLVLAVMVTGVDVSSSLALPM